MPPQPLSSVKKSARIISDPGVLRSRPELAVLIGDVISLWSHIEADLSVVLIRMLGGGVRSGSAMYQAVQSFRVQMTVIDAVAKIEVEHEYLPIFEAVLTLVRRAARKRDKLAHWLWAISPDINDALLLLDPNAAMNYHTVLAERLAKHPQHMDFIGAKDVLSEFDLKTVFVY
jgi:hypothetical protein